MNSIKICKGHIVKKITFDGDCLQQYWHKRNVHCLFSHNIIMIDFTFTIIFLISRLDYSTGNIGWILAENTNLKLPKHWKYCLNIANIESILVGNIDWILISHHFYCLFYLIFLFYIIWNIKIYFIIWNC